MSHSILRRLAVVAIALGLSASSASLFSADPPAAADTADRAAAALYEGIKTYTLDNGLRVYLKPIPSAPVVTVMVAYKVGSSDEDLNSTGLAHYLEHLMFKGTKKLKPGDIDRLTQINGGNNNAYTSEDYTVYHFQFAADRWDVALQIEADRMQNLVIDKAHEFEMEKGAVIEELKRNEDEPWDLELKAVLPMLFGSKEPYGHPVIGEEEHVRAATAKIIKGYYDKWYHPNNAALVICGGFDPDKAIARVKELLGPIPSVKLPERKKADAVTRENPVRKEIPSKFEVARLLLGFNTIRTGEPDYYALEVLDAILSGGKTSRLYRKLIEEERIANTVGTSNSTGRYPGWFSVQVELLKGQDRKKAEAKTLAELDKLRDAAPSAAELKRAKRRLLAGAIFQREGVQGLADSIARGVTTNDLDFLKTYLTKIQAVTAEDVQRVAKTYLDPQKRAVVWSVPGSKKSDAGSGSGAALAIRNPQSTIRNRSNRNRAEPAAIGGSDFSLKNVKRVVLDNGLTVLLFEDHRLPIVVAQADVKYGRLSEPAGQVGVGNLTGRLLDEGTDKHTGPQIAEMIEGVGGQLSLDASGGSVRVLTPDRALGLKILFECLTHAAFPKDALERERQRLLNEIDDTETQPEARAQRTFRALVYGKHPYSRPSLGVRADVVKLTRENVEAFYHKLFVPNNTVVAVVGDFDSDKVLEEIKGLTAEWKKTDFTRPKEPKVEKPEKFTEKILTMPEAAQLHFLMGHVGITRDNPDYYKLLVMDYVLGTGTGFTDRLSATLRDRQGLAYTVTANITSSASEEPGVFACYIGTAPKNFDHVKKSFLAELKRIRDEPPTDTEVENAKKYLLGSLPFRFTTDGRIAEQLLSMERYKLGFGYLDDYRKAVAAVTPADVQAVAKKYLDPEHMVLVAAGAIDAKGKVVAPPPKE